MQVVEYDNRWRAVGDGAHERRVCVEQLELGDVWVRDLWGLRVAILLQFGEEASSDERRPGRASGAGLLGHYGSPRCGRPESMADTAALPTIHAFCPRGRPRRASVRTSPPLALCASCQCPVRRRASRPNHDLQTHRRMRTGASPVPSRGPRRRPRKAVEDVGVAVALRFLRRVNGRKRREHRIRRFGRFAGSFRNDERISSSSAGGQASVCQLGATGGVLMCRLMTAVGSSA